MHPASVIGRDDDVIVIKVGSEQCGACDADQYGGERVADTSVNAIGACA